MISDNLTGEIKNTAIIYAAAQIVDDSTIEYNQYQDLCNNNNTGSRRRGILSGELYQEIIADPNTCFIESINKRIPVLMDIVYGLAMGYDSERCKDSSGKLYATAKILTLPIHELSNDQKNQLANLFMKNGEIALFFSDHNNEESSALCEILNKVGLRYTEKPLVDTRAARGDEQAGLFLYSFVIEQKKERRAVRKLQLIDVFDYYSNIIGPVVTADGDAVTTLQMGDKINDAEATEMWNLYNNKFDFLGENHPISMQDTKEDFLELLRSESTLIALTRTKDDNGDLNRLTCFVYFIDEIDYLYWLNQEYLRKIIVSASEKCENISDIFIPGLVSSGVGQIYSLLPLGLFIKTGDEMGMSACVLYENTNLSKKYVPRIVNSSIRQSCKYSDFTSSAILDKVAYRLWVISNEDE